MTPMWNALGIGAGLAVAVGGLALRRWLRRPHASPASDPMPTEFAWPWFQRKRGGYRTTQDAANAFSKNNLDPGEPTFKLGGILLSAERELGRLILLTGRPDAGKTTLLLMILADLARLWETHPTFCQRWVFLDPSGLLPYLYQIVPPHIDIIRATPDDAEGLAPDFASGIRGESDVLVLGSCLFNEDIARQSSDRFWTQMAREKFEDCVRVFRHLGSDWGIWDPIIAIKYPQFLKPLLAQSPYTRGSVINDLTGRMGQGITASARSVLNELACAASLWRHAKKRFTLAQFLDGQSVLHLQFTPRLSKVVAGLYGALTSSLTLTGLERQDKKNHTLLVLDEARYLAGLATGLLGDVAARGRAAGLHAIVSTQSCAPLKKLLGAEGFEEFIDLVGTWFCLSSGPFTGKLFSDICGDMEGFQDSKGSSTSKGTTDGSSKNYSWSSSPQGGSSSVSHGWSVSQSLTEGANANTALAVKAAILKGEVGQVPFADPKRDCIHGHFFNPNFGCGTFRTDFLNHFRQLPPPPFRDYARRPVEQELLEPWTEAECRDRLRLNWTPELQEALHSTWAQYEQETA